MGIVKTIKRKIEKKAIKKARKQTVHKALQPFLNHLHVIHGPFSGMVYPSTESVGSTLFPKILGPYERELHSFVESLPQRHYSDIVDIGCAEGYYAIGLARMLPDTHVFAYDINQKELDLCKAMQNANHIAESRIRYGHSCTPEELTSLPLGKKALIISDCESYERHLFTPDVIKTLQQHDFLIETHDCIELGIAQELEHRFKDTHDILTITSVDDVQKVRYYQYPELDSFTLTEKQFLLEEQRGNIMEWIFATSKSSKSIQKD